MDRQSKQRKNAVEGETNVMKALMIEIVQTRMMLTLLKNSVSDLTECGLASTESSLMYPQLGSKVLVTK